MFAPPFPLLRKVLALLAAFYVACFIPLQVSCASSIAALARILSAGQLAELTLAAAAHAVTLDALTAPPTVPLAATLRATQAALSSDADRMLPLLRAMLLGSDPTAAFPPAPLHSQLTSPTVAAAVFRPDPAAPFGGTTAAQLLSPFDAAASYIAAARLVASPISAAGIPLYSLASAHNRTGYRLFVLQNGPGPIFTALSASLALEAADSAAAAQRAAAAAVAIAIIAAALTAVAAAVIWDLLRRVGRSRSNLFSVFMIIPPKVPAPPHNTCVLVSYPAAYPAAHARPRCRLLLCRHAMDAPGGGVQRLRTCAACCPHVCSYVIVSAACMGAESAA